MIYYFRGYWSFSSTAPLNSECLLNIRIWNHHTWSSVLSRECTILLSCFQIYLNIENLNALYISIKWTFITWMKGRIILKLFFSSCLRSDWKLLLNRFFWRHVQYIYSSEKYHISDCKYIVQKVIFEQRCLIIHGSFDRVFFVFFSTEV